MAELFASHKSSGNSGRDAKQAACLNCRESKMKCERRGQSGPCMKCHRNGTRCVVPDYHVGRHKGVKNKRTGLEKAVHQIEEALRKVASSSKSQDASSPDQNLQELLMQSHHLLPDAQTAPLDSALAREIIEHESQSTPSNHFRGAADEAYQILNGSNLPSYGPKPDSSDLADAENPLQLLARSPELLLGPDHRNGAGASAQSNTIEVRTSGAEKPNSGDNIHGFFGSFIPRLDIGPDLDPIDLALITSEEADELFSYFLQNLAHTRWGIDPVIHHPTWVRSRSAFLFTSICAASALFLPYAAAISKRLSSHCRKLALNVIENRNRSVEIVLAFMVNVPWMQPRSHWADDESVTYLQTALTIAMDLSLHKVITPPVAPPYSSTQQRISSADRISSKKALELDGYVDLEPQSEWARRLLRRRERTWLALFVVERGVCLARGRRNTVPVTPLVETCDQWHLSDVADPRQDAEIVSMAVLRRELSSLVSRIQFLCDSCESGVMNGRDIVDSIKRDIEGFFDQWYATWPLQIGGSTEVLLPPYVEILASHTRLSLYSSVINHPTAPIKVQHFFRAAGLASALNVMRAAVGGENQLKSMPNNTAIMISFAACFALRLSITGNESRGGLAPSVILLINQTADVLERIGSTPVHRKGASALFAKQLRKILALAQKPPVLQSVPPQGTQPNTQYFNGPLQAPHPPSNFPVEQLDDSGELPTSDQMNFLGMTNDEIFDAVNLAGVGLEMTWADFQFDEGTNLEWLDWPS